MPTMQGARGTGANSVGVTEVNGKQVVNTFRGGQFIIEDKRKKKKKAKPKKKATSNDSKEGTSSIPSWAIVPDANKFTDK